MKDVIEKFGIEIPSRKLEFRKQAGSSRSTSRGSSNHYTTDDVANINALPQLPPNTGCFGSTRITTPDGAVRIDELQSGQILGHGEHLCTVESVLTGYAPRDCFLLRAPYFGTDQDVILAPDQTLVFRSTIAEYLFGSETVMVPIWALADGRKVQHFETRKNTPMYQLQLDGPAPLQVGNCRVSALLKPNTTEGRVLTVQEARSFAAEYRNGFSN